MMYIYLAVRVQPFSMHACHSFYCAVSLDFITLSSNYTTIEGGGNKYSSPIKSDAFFFFGSSSVSSFIYVRKPILI